MKIEVGIVINGDPTRDGTITSETKFLEELFKHNSDCNFTIITVNPNITKRVIREKDTSYSFPHEIVEIHNDVDLSKLESFSVLFTYPTHSNFFGGLTNPNMIKTYKIMSKFTNELNRPVCIRINDSEIHVRDYRKMCEIRKAGDKASSPFLGEENLKSVDDLLSYKQLNYENIYWFANGSKEACDWVVESLTEREKPEFICTTPENVKRNTIYVSDDVFFMIKKNYADYTYLDPKVIKNNRLGYIGFFDTVNTRRATALKALFKKNVHNIPMKIFGKGTENLEALKKYSNIDIEEGFIKGNSKEYFEFLNSNLCYLFIGKGQSESRYIGKTLYDAIVARVPVVVYKKCDEKMICFSRPEFYFETEEELNAIYVKLQDPVKREAWVKVQQKEIFKKLEAEPFKFSSIAAPVASTVAPKGLF